MTRGESSRANKKIQNIQVDGELGVHKKNEKYFYVREKKAKVYKYDILNLVDEEGKCKKRSVANNIKKTTLFCSQFSFFHPIRRHLEKRSILTGVLWSSSCWNSSPMPSCPRVARPHASTVSIVPSSVRNREW